MDTLLTKRQQSVIMLALCFSSFSSMFIVAGSGVFTAAVATELDGMKLFSLCFTLEALTRSIAIAVSGKLGDLMGRKKIYIIGVFGYIIFSIICGIAPNMIIFLTGRLLTGLSWGLFFANTFTMISDVYGNEKRTKMLGYLQSLNTVAMIVAPLVCGTMVDIATWRILFFMVIPFLLISVLLIMKVMPTKKSNNQKVIIDKAGIVLTTLAVCSLTFVLSFGGTFYDWVSPPIIGAFVALLIFTVLLVKTEKTFSEPLFPMQLFKNRNYLAVIGASALFVFISLTGNYFTLFMNQFLGVSATISGTFLMFPNILAVFVSAYIGVLLSKYPVNNKLLMITFAVGTFIGSLLFFTYGVNTSYIVIVTSLFFIGLGTGINSVYPIAYAQKSLPGELIGSGTAFVGFVQGLGNSIGMAIFGLISAFGINYIYKSTVILSVIMLLLVVLGIKKTNSSAKKA